MVTIESKSSYRPRVPDGDIATTSPPTTTQTLGGGGGWRGEREMGCEISDVSDGSPTL